MTSERCPKCGKAMLSVIPTRATSKYDWLCLECNCWKDMTIEQIEELHVELKGDIRIKVVN